MGDLFITALQATSCRLQADDQAGYQYAVYFSKVVELAA
jgi:hypothetical protein